MDRQDRIRAYEEMRKKMEQEREAQRRLERRRRLQEQKQRKKGKRLSGSAGRTENTKTGTARGVSDAVQRSALREKKEQDRRKADLERRKRIAAKRKQALRRNAALSAGMRRLRDGFEIVRRGLNGSSLLKTAIASFAVCLVLFFGGRAVINLGQTVHGNDESPNQNPIRDMIDLMLFAEKEGSSEPEAQSLESDVQQTSGAAESSPEESDSPVVGVTGNYTLATAGGLVVDISRILCPSWIDRQYLTINPYSRPGANMDSIRFIAIHYVGNPGTSAQNNRDYFEKLKDDQKESRSSHFIVGLDGEVIQCIPLNEKSYATNERNIDTISIEVCHPDETGKFGEATYASVVRLTAWLCQQFGLSEEHIIRHYDVTGKICPKYYVENPDAWIQMKADIQAYMIQNPQIE